MKTLLDIVKTRPFPEYAQWWQMGDEFINFMSQSIIPAWAELSTSEADLDQVRLYTAEYLAAVYGLHMEPTLVDDFIHRDLPRPCYSGEFDALSFAFYRSAFTLSGQNHLELEADLALKRRDFTKRVGAAFFKSIQDRLQLNLPSGLSTLAQFNQIQNGLERLGQYLLSQGYLRDEFEFKFSVNVIHAGEQIIQQPSDFLRRMEQEGVGYALYIMGYPVILPSAVYLYQMLGEAQHHSSRMIEELFSRAGCQAHETDDFDPTNFPSEQVVELWEIRQN
jgi:hypothetical protein